MAGIDKLFEIEMLLDCYERSDLDPREFGVEFFNAVRAVIRQGIPARELELCVRVPFRKMN